MILYELRLLEGLWSQLQHFDDFRMLAGNTDIWPVLEPLDSVPDILENTLGLPVVAQSWSDENTWTDVKV